MAEDHSRWCPRCSGWATESELRVPADGKPRHKACGSVTLAKTHLGDDRPQTGIVVPAERPRGVVGGPPLDCAPWPDAEARELAGRMALDEAAAVKLPSAAELQAFTAAGDALFTCHACGGPYPLVEGTLVAHDLPGIGRCAGSGEVPRPIGGPVPWDHPDADPAADLAAVARIGQAAGAFSTGSPKLEVSETVAKHLRASGVPEDTFVVRDGGVGVTLEPIEAGADGTVMLGGVPKTLTTMASWRRAFAADLRRLLPQVTAGAKLHADHVTALAGAFIEAGWVPGARRRAEELPKATATLAEDDRYEDQPVVDTDGTVIGHIWELERRFLLEHPREWVAAVDDNTENRPRFGSREGAEAWVRANAPRDGRPLTVPYDAEKVLGLKSAVVGWVWLDPEHAGDDGRWLAVHGAHPEHQHPLFGSKGPGLDARNQAIGWVLEQDKAARS